jgi:hypothetical protein
MKPFLAPALCLLIGIGIGYVANTGKAVRGSPAFDLQSDIEFRRGAENNVTYRPHSVHIDGKRVYLSDAPAIPEGVPVTIFTLDSGRVKIATTEVTK